MPDASSVEELRQRFGEIIDRARSDPEGFGAQLDKNPQQVFKDAGFEGAALGEVTSEIRSVQRGQKPDDGRYCDYTTCWISWCNHWGTFRTS